MLKHLRTSIFVVGVSGTVMILASLFWNVSQVQKNTLDEARIQARIAYDEDIVYRNWNTLHGGVYVRVTEEMQPNPYLADVEERDLVTTAGEMLTLVNPALMTRQAHELSAEWHNVTGHLTSLNPIRPENKPDRWEWAALVDFEEGAEEVSSVAMLNGEEYLRFMRPLVAEQECVSCHAGQAYSPGEIRGGISVGVPMKPLRAIERGTILKLILAHAALWTIGFSALLLGGRTLIRAEQARTAAEEDLKIHARKLEESNRLKDLFTDIMRHDLINPTGIINCYADFILEREVDPRTRDFSTKIKHTASRLINMIDNASRFTDLQGADTVECEALDLGAVIEEAMLEVEECCSGAGVALIYHGEGEYPIRANPMLGNVFSNLFSNAAKYAAEGELVQVDIEDAGPLWNVSVKDYGEGIPDEEKERIFCRFERLRKEGVRGTGLGLAISRHLVQLHDGGIWVEDGPAGGAVFKVSLPKEGPMADRSELRRLRLLTEERISA